MMSKMTTTITVITAIDIAGVVFHIIIIIIIIPIDVVIMMVIVIIYDYCSY